MSRGKHSSAPVLSGEVIETVGRRVRVRHADEEIVCFLSGQRAVIGDEVRFVRARGEGGKLTEVLPRKTRLARVDHRGREQVLAANLRGVVIVETANEPPLAPVILDRYLVAAWRGGLRAMIALNKVDQPTPPEAQEQIALRAACGVPTLEVSAHQGQGLEALREAVREAGGAWALVGRSGVGKTSLVHALLPHADAGPVGELSAYWGLGKHTTTSSTRFELGQGAALIDSPGIRSFTPAGLQVADLRTYFPGMSELRCAFRDCLHREGEQGCTLEGAVHPELVRSYRTLLTELLEIEAGTRRGRGEQEKRRT